MEGEGVIGVWCLVFVMGSEYILQWVGLTWVVGGSLVSGFGYCGIIYLSFSEVFSMVTVVM